MGSGGRKTAISSRDRAKFHPSQGLTSEGDAVACILSETQQSTVSTQGTSAAPPSPAIRSASPAPADRSVVTDGAPELSTTRPNPSGIAGSEQLDNRALLRWMLRFIRPVKGL